MNKYPRFRDESVDKPKKCAKTQCRRCWGEGVVGTYGTCFRCNGRKYDPTDKRWAFPRNWTDEQCQEFLDKKMKELHRRLEAKDKKAGIN